ncbi:desulfoferrodoxin [Blautia liquoris]|uniref:Desulfoferrodoxin n=1 Tax=Blautia liquoris TaxID=2779518 RepID=A0A7M2RKK9_9FIRM|nr:desulfoferrodoxin family protein [Blautia liquoris]QOV19882.1 desulfoferrodoxin [Blautia liquoris]
MSDSGFYRCDSCGTTVYLLKKGGCEPSCCGKTMTQLKVNAAEAATEKHIPAVERTDDGKLKVTVGSTLHPMTSEHFIEWIALKTDDRVDIRYLKPQDQPTAVFDNVLNGSVYAYCNLHGLWIRELDFVIPDEGACSAEFPQGCVIPD